MLRRAWQVAALILLASSAAWLQFFLIDAWPAWFGQLNLVLIVLVFALFFFNWQSALWLALILGGWLDVLSFYWFGLFIISLCLVALGTQFALKNWLTNRSLYSFAVLISGATVLYDFLLNFLVYLWRPAGTYFFIAQSSFWLNLAYQLSWSLIFALFLFHLATGLTRQLKPFFLEKKRLV